MRGRGFEYVKQYGEAGITPAYAGKSFGYASFIAFMWDHPRVCGEEGWIVLFLIFGMGSPPRMRGRERQAWPASAAMGDHPRVCGEEFDRTTRHLSAGGITPAYAGKRIF